MSQQRRNQNGQHQNGQNHNGQKGRQGSANVPKPTDLWRPVPQLPDVVPIATTPDPAVLVRSLGDPPLMNKSTIAGHYIATVVERAAGLASALAASVDLLVVNDNDD